MRKYDRIAGISLIILGIAVTIYSFVKLSLGDLRLPGPGFFPFLCGLSIIIFTGLWIIPTWNDKDESSLPFWGKGEWVRPLICVILVSVYGGLMDILGYTVSTFVFLLAWQFILEREKWLRAVTISVVGSASMYLLFTYMLMVSLPESMF